MRRISPARVLSLVLVSVVIASVLTALTWPSAPPGPRITPIAEAPDTASAKQAALLQGSRVEVADQRAETRTVYANPNGTMTAEYAVQPVRVRQGDRWVPLDTTLAQRPDGAIAPKAGDLDLTLSGGGPDTPLVRVVKDGKEIALAWPGPLPVPAIDGNTATYAEVLSGVDLVVRAMPSTAAQYLVIKNAEAARNPALTRVRLGMRTTGLKVTVTDAGGLEARDPTNALIFAAPPSAMWDSATPAREAIAGVEVDDESLTVIPDQKLLRDPEARFPITVDPDLHTWNWWGWTSVLSGSDTPRWNCSAAGCNVAQVGYCYPAWVGPSCNGIGVGRSYFQFNTHDGTLNNSRVLGGALETVVMHSPDCNGIARHHELFHTAGHIDGNTRWGNAPQGGRIASVPSPKVNGEHGCGGNKGIGFGVPADQINRGDPATYFIKASDESHNENGAYWWRKYDPAQTRLRVDFNHKPRDPYNLATDPPLPAPCHHCKGLPYIGQGTMTLKAALSDPDNDHVRPKWRVAADGVEIAAWDGAYQASGANHDAPINLQNGKRFNWWMHAEDDHDVTDPGVAGPGPWMVDTVGVSQKPKVKGSLYLQDNRWHGGVGVPGTFTFEWAEDPTDPNADRDIDHYLYDTVDPPTAAKSVNAEGDLGGPATITFAPKVDGPQDLFVWAVDRAGHRSPKQTFHFYVRAGNGALAEYPFDGNAEDTAFLGDRDGTVNGNASYGPGAVSSAIQLDGQPGSWVSAPNAVRTDTSFSVSAWVRAEPVGSGRVMGAVSQDGNRQSSFFLSYRGELNKWRFTMVDTDSDNSPATVADSPGAAALGVWTHLTGVYDRPMNKIRLYVNGVLATESTLRTTFVPWNATGPLGIGRQKCNGNTNCDPWRGAIDEVQVYDRVLSTADVRAIVGRDNVAVGYWKFDETEGTNARNDVDGGPSMVLSGAASFTGKTGGAMHGGVHFDGSTGQAATSGPVVRTDQSFTVAAWVKADRFVTGTHMTAVSQEGTYNSGFSLQYNSGHQKWLFLETTADGPSFDHVGAVGSQQPAIGEWTHLAGVYDAAADELRIYVNGQLGGTNTWAAPWNATGPLIVGRGKWQGGPSEFWPGAIDDVRAYNRDLSEEEIRGLVVRGNVTAGNWKLDGDAQDSSQRGLNGTINGAADWAGGQTSVPAPTDLAVRLSGTAHISTGPAVDVKRGFSVAAWARLDVVGGTAKQTVVSQDGSQVSAFKLRASPEGKWSFAMFGTDSGAGGAKDEVVGGAVQVGLWTHLVGVYDASSHEIALYVNGVLAATGAHTQTWNHAAGGLQIGRSKSSGSPSEYFPGAIDDVTAYSRILFAEEIQTLAGRDLTLAHNWALDEASGTLAGDSVGVRAGTISGATHVPGKLGNALHFNGTDNSASTSAVDIDTSKSFTVASWVHLERICVPSGAPSCKLAAVSLDGGQTSKFRLGHLTDDDNNPFGTWFFEMPESDGRVIDAAVAGIESDIGSWVHLVGVYDAPVRKIWIYVNGNRQGDGSIDVPWAAAGGLRLGRGREDGVNTEWWHGEVDEVRLYTGALDAARIENLVASYPEQGGETPTMPTDPLGYWRFDDTPGGTVAADSSGGGRPATLAGGASFGGWYLGVNGTSAYAQTAGPVLDTSRSFSVAAWAYMDRPGGGIRTVVGQDGNRVSTFAIQFRPDTGAWTVRIPGTDADNPTLLKLASSEPAAFGDWQHVAVVYDADPNHLRQLRLYVNGVLSAVARDVTIRNGTGPLSIGRGKWNGGHNDFFNDNIDDVRAFDRPLSDGEVRKIHDDRYAGMHGSYQFDDGTGRDRAGPNHLTLTGGTSFVSGISGKALQLNGTSGAGTAGWAGTSMRDSFTVSAWAKLATKDRDYTVVGQDGVRLSGFVLQYKRSLDRWVFGGPIQDADSMPLEVAYADSLAVTGQWVHLVGVYDFAARQLRLYVNGTLAGTRNDVRLAVAHGPLSVGRGKFNGNPADYFAGEIDEVVIDKWMASPEEIAERAGYPRPAPGQLGRFVNDLTGARYTARTDDPIRAGYRFERSLGVWVAAGANTRPLYSCLSGVDVFTSTDPGCESGTKVADLGSVYIAAPAGQPTMPLYRCRRTGDVFDSLLSDCDGATQETVLGHVRAYGRLARYYSRSLVDHVSTTYDTAPGYRLDGHQGWLAKLSSSGTTPLIACREGSDYFLSVDAACEGKTVLGTTGHIWTSPPAGAITTPLMRCLYAGQRFISVQANCDGQPVDRQLGHILTALP